MVSDELRLRLPQSESLLDILFLNKGSGSLARFNLTKQLSSSGKQLLWITTHLSDKVRAVSDS